MMEPRGGYPELAVSALRMDFVALANDRTRMVLFNIERCHKALFVAPYSAPVQIGMCCA